MWSFCATLRLNSVTICAKNVKICSWWGNIILNTFDIWPLSVLCIKRCFCAYNTFLSMLTFLSSNISICQLIMKLRPGQDKFGSTDNPTYKHRTKKWGLCRACLRCCCNKRKFHVLQHVAFSYQYESWLLMIYITVLNGEKTNSLCKIWILWNKKWFYTENKVSLCVFWLTPTRNNIQNMLYLADLLRFLGKSNVKC